MSATAKRAYQTELDELLRANAGRTPTLMLHVCCAPCASYVLEYLSPYFMITAYYDNPNIAPPEEYYKRLEELKRLITLMPLQNPVRLIEGAYDPERFYSRVTGLEQEPEGGARCSACFELRLGETARLAKETGCEYFASTLSISPHKDAGRLGAIGDALASRYGVAHLPSDFKKRGGYQRSTQLCAQYGIYRQSFCGCAFSLTAR